MLRGVSASMLMFGIGKVLGQKMTPVPKISSLFAASVFFGSLVSSLTFNVLPCIASYYVNSENSIPHDELVEYVLLQKSS